jgi:hypothetical protein
VDGKERNATARHAIDAKTPIVQRLQRIEAFSAERVKLALIEAG